MRAREEKGGDVFICRLRFRGEENEIVNSVNESHCVNCRASAYVISA